jgi:hypothetical protein
MLDILLGTSGAYVHECHRYTGTDFKYTSTNHETRIPTPSYTVIRASYLEYDILSLSSKYTFELLKRPSP